MRDEIRRTDVVHVHGMLFMSSALASYLARAMSKPLVVGEEGLPLIEDALLDELLDSQTRDAFESGSLEVIAETLKETR